MINSINTETEITFDNLKQLAQFRFYYNILTKLAEKVYRGTIAPEDIQADAVKNAANEVLTQETWIRTGASKTKKTLTRNCHKQANKIAALTRTLYAIEKNPPCILVTQALASLCINPSGSTSSAAPSMTSNTMSLSSSASSSSSASMLSELSSAPSLSVTSLPPQMPPSSSSISASASTPVLTPSSHANRHPALSNDEYADRVMMNFPWSYVPVAIAPLGVHAIAASLARDPMKTSRNDP